MSSVRNYAEEADRLKPFIVPWIAAAVSGGAGGQAASAALTRHNLNGPYHFGELSQSQAPWAVTDTEFATHTSNADAHHAKLHDILSATNHAVTGSALDIIGLTATDTLGKLTPSSAPGAAEALLKSSAAGNLTLPTVTATTKLTTPTIDTASGDLAIVPAGGDVNVTGAVNATTNSNLTFSGTAVNDSLAPHLLLRRAKGTIASPTGVTTGAAVGNISFRGYHSGGDYHSVGSADIRAVADENFTASAAGAHLRFYTTPAATTSLTERMRIAGNGNVDIAVSATVPLLSTASGNMEISPAGDLILDPVGNDVLPELNYDINLGAINRKYLTLHAAELWIETLVAQETIATIGGRILVGPTNILEADLAPGDTTITVKYNNFLSGDRIYMEAAGSLEFMAVTSTYSGTGPYIYSVTRNLDGTGANQWYAGDALFNTGQTGNGWIDLYSLYGMNSAANVVAGTQRAGPTIVGNVRLSSTYNDFRERWAVGSLNGLYDYSSEIYGFAAGNPTATWVGLDATYGLRMMSGSTKRLEITPAGVLNINNSAGSNVITLDASGNSYFSGVMTIGTSGEIRQGTGTLGSDYTGLRIWRSGNVGRIGGYNDDVLQWFADTDGRLYTGGQNVQMGRDGINLQQDDAVSPDAGRAISWWADIDVQTGTPTQEIAAFHNSLGQNILSFTVTPEGGIYDEALVVLQAGSETLTLYDSDLLTTSATFSTHTVQPSADSTYNIGTSDYYYDHAYIRNLHIDTIVGTPTYSHTHSAGDITSGTLDLARIPSTLTGKDADTVDGYHAASFSLTSHTHSYLPLGGGTMTGNILFSGSQTVDGVDISAFYAAYAIHNHDDRYYTESEINALLSGYVPTTRQVVAGSGLSGGGALSADVTLNHADTSSVADSSNSNGVVMQSLTFDTYGHVLTRSTVDLDSRFVNVTGDTMTGTLIVPTVTTPTIDTASGDLAIVPAGGDVNVTGAVNATTNSNLTFSGTAVNDSLAAHLLLRRAKGTIASPTGVTTGAAVGNISFRGYHSGGDYHSVGSADIRAVADENFTASAAGAHLRFYTTPAATTALTERMRIAGNGNVDIAVSATVPLLSTASGNMEISPAGDLILDPIGGGNINVGARLTAVAWDIYESGLVSFGPDADKNQVLGRAIVGYAPATDSASFAHYDYNTSVSFALAQYNTGATVVNAASGRQIGLAVAGVDTLTINDAYVLPRGNMQVGLGDYNRKFSGLYAFEFIVDNLVASDVMATIGGRILVSPTTYLETDFGYDSNTISVTHNNLGSGDWAYMAAYINGSAQAEYLRVRGSAVGSGPYSYTVERQAHAADTTTLLADMTGPATTMDLVGNQPVVGDIVQLSDYANSKLESVLITGGPSVITGGYRYTVTRDATGVNGFGLAWSTGQGVKISAKSWETGNAIVSTGGAVGDGYIELTSTETLLSQYGPTISITSRTDADTWNGLTEVVALGNLRSRADYGASDISGLIVANDASLTPTSGLQALTADSSNGVRLFNVDLSSYNSSVQTVDLSATGNLKLGSNVTNAATTTFDFTASTGVLRVGPLAASKPNLYWDATNLKLRINTTDYIKLSASAATFEGPINLGTGGGIYQGTGSFATPTTGLKIWNDSGVGRLSTYNSGTAQVYFDTSGILNAGAGNVKLDANGISFNEGSVNSTKLKFYNGANLVSQLYSSSGIFSMDTTGLSTTAYLKLHAQGSGGASDGAQVLIGTIGSVPQINFNLGASIVASMSGSAFLLDSLDLDMNGNDITDIGVIGEAPTNLSFNTGWTHYGGSYGNGQYKKIGDIVLMRGMVKRTSGSSATIATLPVGYRPPASYINIVQTDTGPSAVTISSTGTITLAAGGGTGWISLNGVVIIL